MRKGLLVVLLLTANFCVAFAQATEDLDEMFARSARIASGNFVYNVSFIENPSTYLWQPETLMYTDTQTGHEVWRMSNTPNLNNYYHNDIGVSPWSADGKRLAFTGWKRYTKAYPNVETRDNGNSYIWMISDTDGKNLRPAVGSPRRVGGGYFHWSQQIPETFYDIGSSVFFPWNAGPDSTALYKATVGDTVISSAMLLSLPVSGTDIGKFVSADGRKIIATLWTGDTTPYVFYPLTVHPENQAIVDDASGFSPDRGFGPYGNTPNLTIRYHDAYYAGDGSWYFGMPSGCSTWWRIKTLGSAADSGGLYTGDKIAPADQPPYDFGEVWPENHGSLIANRISSPWVQVNPFNPSKTCYWSHFVPDVWGRYALYSASCDNLPKGYGPAVWDIQNHIYSVASFGGGAQHHDWHGFTDWTVSSGGPSDSATGRGATLIYAQKYNDINSQITVANAHTRYYGGDAYNSLIRPGQSPDGTKVAWHSEFLNSANKTDIFWAVVYYPYPPTNLSASYNSGVRLSFLPPKYTERGWPYASSSPQKDSLGWPLLDSSGNEIGEPLYAREIKRYHVWRSSLQSGPWQEIGTVDAQYSPTYAEDPNMMMLHPVVNGIKVSLSNKISFTDNPGSGTFYYAITSEEHSGLESRDLSEILRVAISGTSISGQVVQQKGQTRFWTTPPQAPANFFYNATGTQGHYRLSWAEPADTKIRYYNIYYSSTGNPTATQTRRIASVPAGTNTLLDWLAGATAYYGIASVDRYGNEGAVAYASTGFHPADTNRNMCVEFSELSAAITSWKSNAFGMSQLMSAIVMWKRGCP